MKKISTLFKKNPENLGLVINEVDPENQWVIDGEGIATRKFDGTACAIINGELYKRYDAKNGKPAPVGGIPCQDPDPITGHWPHWIKCDRSNPADKYHFEGLDNSKVLSWLEQEPNEIHTFELIGPKIQGNPEKYNEHTLVMHGSSIVGLIGLSFEDIGWWLENSDVEGIVFHHKTDGRMCKIRKSDYGFKR